MLYQIEDEFGQVWYVGKGDPAHKAVQMLHTRHYTWLVLPYEYIIGLNMIPTRKEMIRTALRIARQMGYNSQGGRRHIRLAECLKILGG